MREFINIIEGVEIPDRFSVATLPFDRDSLAPVISRRNLDFHYDTLYTNYVKKFNKGVDPDWNGAGAFLHELFFTQLKSPDPSNKPDPEAHARINDFITDYFKKLNNFKKEFNEIAAGIHGSGWCYLSKSGEIKTIENHDTELDIILIVDMWEHSYYLDYGPDKDKYLKDIWQIIDWNVINQRL